MSRAAEQEEDEDGPKTDRPMTLGQHLDELRKRLFRAVVYVLVCAVGVAIFEKELMGFVLAPYVAVLDRVPNSGIQMTEISEAFFVFMKFDLVVGIFFASPFVLYEIWGFVAKGLYAHERRVVQAVAPVSALLFVSGCLFYYFVIQPPALEFLLTANIEIPLPGGRVVQIHPMPRIDNVFSFFLTMALVMGLTFELPLGMVAAQKFEVATWRTYSKYRRHFLMASLVAMAVLTPSGDMFTLGICMLPVVFLFEGGIVACWFMKPDVPKDAPDEENA